MNYEDQLYHAIDVKSRIREVIHEMEKWPKGNVDTSYVAYRLDKILSKAEDAGFELRCREADRMAELGITNE